MSLITDVAHLYSVAIADLKKTSSFVENHVLPALKAVKADMPTVEAITALVSPQAANVERVGEAILGLAIKVVGDAEAAGGAGGLKVDLDAALVADIKAILPAIKDALKAINPVPTPAPAK